MSKGDKVTTKEMEPWSQASPYLKEGFSEAANLYNNFKPTFYEGPTQAGFSPDELTAQQGIRDFAVKGAPELMNPAIQGYQQGMNPNMLDVANNPYVNNMAQAASDRAMSSLQPELAGIRGNAVMSGGYGGGRQGIAEGNALAGAADSANQAAAQIYGGAYGQGLGHQANTLGMTGGLMNAGFSPYGALGASGGQQQGREQALIKDAMAQQQFTQNQPYDKFNKYQQGIAGFSGLVPATGQQVSTTPGASAMSNIGGLAQAASLMGLGFG